MEKPSPDLNVIEVRSAVNNIDLNQMSKQRLMVTLSTPAGLHISGPVRTRATCELFQSPLSSPEKPSGTSGMAWMYIDKLGALKYYVRLYGIDQPDLLGLG